MSALRWWGPLGLYMALIFFVSSRPRPPSLDDTPDVALHGGAYFVMAVLAVRALARGLDVRPSGAVLAGAVALSVAYGVSDEIHQSFVPSRMGSVDDVVFDALGAIAAAVSLHLYWYFRTRNAG